MKIKGKTLLTWILVIILLSAIGIALWGFCLENDPQVDSKTGNLYFVDAYQENARAPIFTAFITMGSFLLTLKTVILQRLKEGFDTQKYKELYLSHRESNPNVTYYGSLNRLSIALALAILLSFLTSLLQMSLGFVPHATAVLLCLYLALISVSLTLYLAVQMFLAHKEWLAKIEKERVDEILREESAETDE